MFGCYNCTVLRSEKVKEEIRTDLEKKTEEIKQLAKQLGLTANIAIIPNEMKPQ